MTRLDARALATELWSLLDALQNSTMSPDDVIETVFGLVVLKHIADQPAPGDGTPPRWRVPERATWASILRAGRGFGDALSAACQALAMQNQPLQDVVGGLDFNQVEAGASVRRRDDVLLPLLRRLDTLSLNDQHLVSADALGDACSILLERWAVAARIGHESQTPLSVARLMATLLEPADGMSVYDPVCGLGMTLAMAADCAAKRAQRPRSALKVGLFGQEWNARLSRLCRMNLLLQGMDHAVIRTGNVLREPLFVEQGALRTFDRVLADPPFSLSGWGAALAEHDPFQRYTFGVPHSDQGDYAFIQHCWASLRPRSGRAVILVMPGVLFRGGVEGRIRQAMLEADAITAVVSLRPKLLYGTALAPALVVMDRAKHTERRGHYLLIEASQEMLQESSPQDQARLAAHVLRCCQTWEEEPGFARVVSLEELAQVAYDLQPRRHVIPGQQAQERPDMDHLLRQLARLQQERQKTFEQMDELITKRLGRPPGK